MTFLARVVRFAIVAFPLAVVCSSWQPAEAWWMAGYTCGERPSQPPIYHCDQGTACIDSPRGDDNSLCCLPEKTACWQDRPGGYGECCDPWEGCWEESGHCKPCWAQGEDMWEIEGRCVKLCTQLYLNRVLYDDREATWEERKEWGLDLPNLYEGQVVTLPERVRVELKDRYGAALRLRSGTTIALDECKWTPDHGKYYWSLKFHMLLGTIWAKTCNLAFGDRCGRVEPRTERLVTSVRGTYFSMSRDPRIDTTTVHVNEGEVAMQMIDEPETEIVLGAGETGVQVGENPPQKLPGRLPVPLPENLPFP